MAVQMTTYWGFTLNNPTEAEMALVHNGYPDYMRELIHELERGEDGTVHIQGWIRLLRSQRLSFVKKLIPRAHFVFMSREEYVENMKRYVQKQDATAISPVVHTWNDPDFTLDRAVKIVISRMILHDPHWLEDEYCRRRREDLRPQQLRYVNDMRRDVELDLVREVGWRIAKIFVSASYTKLMTLFLHEMIKYTFDFYDPRNENAGGADELVINGEDTNNDPPAAVIPTFPDAHTHTHTQNPLMLMGFPADHPLRIFTRANNIQNADEIPQEEDAVQEASPPTSSPDASQG